MNGVDTVAENGWLVQAMIDYGLWLLVPLSLIEGPVVNVIAGWLASIDLMNAWAALVILTVGDVAGDVILYYIGRGARVDRLPVIGKYLKVPRAKLVPWIRAFRDNGVRILVIGKLTQAAGALVLVAAGAARVPMGQFILVNFLAAIPKTIALFILGWVLGEAHGLISGWLSWLGVVATVVVVIWLGIWYWRRRQREAGGAGQEPVVQAVAAAKREAGITNGNGGERS